MQPERQVRPVRCDFYARTPSRDGKFHYDQISVKGPVGSSGELVTLHPPEIGDRISLSDEFQRVPSGAFQVLERHWAYAAYGSIAWPYGLGPAPHLNIIIEACEGPFQNESDLPSPHGGN